MFAWMLVACLVTGCDKDKPAADGPPSAAMTPAAKSPDAEPAGPASLVKKAQKVVKWMAKGDFESLSKTFDEGMRKAFPDRASFGRWWAPQIRANGKLRKQFAATANGRTVAVTVLFARSPADIQVSFNAKAELMGLHVTGTANRKVRPQTPMPPFPYTSREVSYDNPKNGTKIAGTLTIPGGDGPHPAIFLISGSGQQDRDSTMEGHKPFLLLADHLSRKGIAVLRADDRGVGKSTGNAADETVELIVAHTEASLAFLKNQKEIDRKRIGLVGHSVGGLIGPMVASSTAGVAFVVSLAGPSVPGVVLVPNQVGAMLKSDGRPKEVIAAIVAAHQKLAPLIAANAPASKLEPGIAALLAANKSFAGGDPRRKKSLEQKVRKALATPWYRSFMKSDPARYLSRLKVPILVMHGDKDPLVVADLHAPAAKKALAKAGNKRARVERLPGLNHLFQNSKTGRMNEYVLLTETFDKGALEMLTKWLLETVGLASATP